MIRARRLLAKLRSLARAGRTDEELTREIAAHLALLEEDFERRGLSPEVARTAARRTLGGIEQVRQAHRDERSFLWLVQARQDLLHACRTFARNPGFTLVAIVTLAFGIGVNTALFTAYDAVALRPLPVADPGRVVRLERWFAGGWLGDMQYGFSWPEYLACRAHQDAFSEMVATSWPMQVLGALPGTNAPSQGKTLQGQLVSGNYFSSFGVDAILGRTFTSEESRVPGANPVLVLSYSFWQRALQGDPHIIGALIKINGTAFSIIGVAPRTFTGTSLLPRVPDFWAPASMQAQLLPGQDWLHQPGDDRFQVFGLLRPGVPLSQAQAETASLIHQFSRTYIPLDPTINVTLQHTAFFGNTNDPRFEAGIAALMLLVALVFFVACANVANMMLARGAARQREIGLRLALGATRARVIRQLITESLLLSSAGGAVGLALAALASHLLHNAVAQVLTAQLGGDFALSINLNPDARVLTYAIALSIAAGVIFGLSPALQFTRPELATSLRDDTASFGHRLRRSHLRSLLIGGQVAVSMLLLTCSGLLVRGLMKAQSAEPGFDTRDIYLLLDDYGDHPVTAVARFHRLFDRLQDLPQLAGIAYGRGPMMGTWAPPILVHGSGAVQGVTRAQTLASYASQNYFHALGIALVRGRTFTPEESVSGAHVAVISEATARRFWPGQDPLGRHFQLDLHFTAKFTDFEVIGIAQDVRFFSLTRIDAAHVYLAPDPALTYPILLRIGPDPQAAFAAVWKAVDTSDRDLLPSLALWNAETMLIHPQRTLARVMALFAAGLALLAVALAGVGIYGVMAYAVSQRTREIGIQMALGARSGEVLHQIALWGLRPVLAGMLAGLACGAALSALLHSTLSFPGSSDFLYGVRFYDPWTFAAISLFLMAVSLLASLVPALRAVRIDPLAALRCE